MQCAGGERVNRISSETLKSNKMPLAVAAPLTVMALAVTKEKMNPERERDCDQMGRRSRLVRT